jgi:hypothetical protein
MYQSSVLHNSSGNTIKFQSTHDGTTARINKNLLCFFSTYYTSALNGHFAEAKNTLFKVDLSPSLLEIFKTWIYKGTIDLAAWDYQNRVDLYAFADQKDMIALRRQLLPMGETRMARYKEVEMAFSLLPDTSPFCRRIVDCYVGHFKPAFDACDPPSNFKNAHLYSLFLDQVTQGLEEKSLSDSSGGECTCCNACNYHEHDSAEEWMASRFILVTCHQRETLLLIQIKSTACGQITNTKKPSFWHRKRL